MAMLCMIIYNICAVPSLTDDPPRGNPPLRTMLDYIVVDCSIVYDVVLVPVKLCHYITLCDVMLYVMS